MITDAIKERLNLFRLYLGLVLASIGTITVWTVQNFDNIQLIKFIFIAIFALIKMIVSVFIELKIRKEINLLRNV